MRRPLWGALGLAWLCLGGLGHAGTVVLHLRNGDRISGAVISETTDTVVMATPWLRDVPVALDQIECREFISDTSGLTTNPPVVVVSSINPSAPARNLAAADQPEPPKAAKPWKVEAKFGLDLIRGAKDSQNFYGAFTLAYVRPYESAPTRLFRNRFESQAAYARTDGVESADRFFASDRVDFDISQGAYAYNYAGGGFDLVRKIESQYEIGPGVGDHLLRQTNLAANVEGGFSFQAQNREDAEPIDAMYLRVGQDLAWKFVPKINFTQRVAWLTRVDAPEQMQLRLEGNLAFALMQNLSFNFTAQELYDTRPVPGVTPSEFQLRSSFGLNF